MTLNLALLSHTDTPPSALAFFTPSLVTPLSAIRVCEEMKLRWSLKRIVFRPQRLTHFAKTCCDLPNFHRR